ncbi:MAG: response regulator transcription factor [Liquorilactobacillus ghanensis]|uniref:response regulator transcription factor n=1 Tax=Liquorilactobacillus ghanensis TaxID=399370 RepID=UPI00070F7CCA|nr:response regulator transcription factor [Liquorilactobacillus ghanensis]
MKKNRVLIVEDDPEIARLIEITLRAEKYDYEHAVNGRETFSLLGIFKPELLLLDLMLPDIDGVDIIKKVRKTSRIPIIIVSAREEDSDKVGALDAGADDYLVKPFSVEELLARIRVALRRISYEQENEQVPAQKYYYNGDLLIDYARQTVLIKNQAVHLTPTEYKVLCLLAQNASRVLTHHYLLKKAWGEEMFEDNSSLRVTIATLRKKIECTGKFHYIKTHIGIGYQMLQYKRSS